MHASRARTKIRGRGRGQSALLAPEEPNEGLSHGTAKSAVVAGPLWARHASPMTPNFNALAERAAIDGELRLAGRPWRGGIRLTVGDVLTGFTVTDGVIEPRVPEAGPDVVSIDGTIEAWTPLLEAVPPRFATGVLPFATAGLLNVDADPVRFWQ